MQTIYVIGKISYKNEEGVKMKIKVIKTKARRAFTPTKIPGAACVMGEED